MDSATKKCPPHNNGPVITDDECHNHQNDLHQYLHNAHCRALRCLRACSGSERNQDVPTFPPRDIVEKSIGRIAPLVPINIQNRTLGSKKGQQIITKIAGIIHRITQKIPKIG